MNSWDVITEPRRLGDLLGTHLANPLGNGRELAAGVGYMAFLALAYVVLYTLSSLRLELEQSDVAR